MDLDSLTLSQEGRNRLNIGGRIAWLNAQLSEHARLEAEKAVRQIGFYETRIVPLLNGWELDRGSAAQYLHEYPELHYFIERE